MSQRLWWVSTTAWQRARRISLENQAIQSSIDLLCILCYLLIESLGLGISEPAMPLPLESGGGWGIHEGRLWFYLVGPVLWHCWFASRKDVRLVRKRRLSLELSFWKLEQEKLSGKQITRINCIRCIWYVCVCVCARNSIMYEWYITVVYKCLHVLAPTYLADDCLTISAIAGKRHLRSAGTGILSIPRTRTTLGMRSFVVAGPVIWNSLPAALWTATLSPLTFARHLKAHLFCWSTAHLRTVYDTLYKSTHHHHQLK